MISLNHGSLTLENVGKFYFLKCVTINLADLLKLFENIHNFQIISIKLSGIYRENELYDKDLNFSEKGVKDCFEELKNYCEFEEISAAELELVQFEILWYDEIIEENEEEMLHE